MDMVFVLQEAKIAGREFVASGIELEDGNVEWLDMEPGRIRNGDELVNHKEGSKYGIQHL
jgi:hypothetical protein